ncbi:MAG TPA: hypothetical protein PKB13_02360 [Clostridia bacterium]|nr:hypothetical protein [Clostridia bacterium]
MALDMRALYYIVLPHAQAHEASTQQAEEEIKANENCLNQNFTILAQKLAELEWRLSSLESGS